MIGFDVAEKDHQERRIGLRYQARHEKWLDKLRVAEPDLPTRAEMVRRLIERAAKKAGLGGA